MMFRETIKKRATFLLCSKEISYGREKYMDLKYITKQKAYIKNQRQHLGYYSIKSFIKLETLKSGSVWARAYYDDTKSVTPNLTPLLVKVDIPKIAKY